METERPIPSKEVASKLKCNLAYLLRRATEANIQNWCGEVRAWFSCDVEMITPLVRKRSCDKVKNWSKAAQMNLKNQVRA